MKALFWKRQITLGAHGLQAVSLNSWLGRIKLGQPVIGMIKLGQPSLSHDSENRQSDLRGKKRSEDLKISRVQDPSLWF